MRKEGNERSAALNTHREPAMQGPHKKARYEENDSIGIKSSN